MRTFLMVSCHRKRRFQSGQPRQGIGAELCRFALFVSSSKRLAIPLILELLVSLLSVPSASAQALTIEERYERAAQLFHGGKTLEAEKEFQTVQRAIPQAPEPYYFLGRICVLTERTGEARSLLEKAVALKPGFLEAWQALAQVYMKQEAFPAARTACLKVLELNPGSETGHFNLGLVLKELGENDAAIEEFEMTLKKGALDSPVQPKAKANLGSLRMEKARLLFQNERFPEALRELELAQSFLTASPGVLELRGDIYLKLKDPRAVEIFQRTLAINPSPLVWEKYSQALLANRLWAQAIAILGMQVKEDPKIPLFRILLGSVYWDQSEYQKALEEYQEAALLDPSSVRTHYLVGYIHQLLGNLPAAKSSLEKALKLNGNFLPAMTLLGELLADEGKRLDAVGLLEEVTAKDPSDLRVRLRLGQIYLELKRSKDALKHLKAAEELEPREKRVHYLLGRLYQSTGQIDLAQQEFSVFSKIELEEFDKKRQE